MTIGNNALFSRFSTIINDIKMYRACVRSGHKKKQIKNCTRLCGKKYYIIRYDDPQASGWTVWERVALYGAIYAEDHNMIPVMDMTFGKNIYQENENDNPWEKYYEQLGGVRLSDAISSNNYIIGDSSVEWFFYERARRRRIITVEYLRKKYQQYIVLKKDVCEYCEREMESIFQNKMCKEHRMLGVALRGSDYRTFNHPNQPSFAEMLKEVCGVFEQYHCDYYYIFTEDKEYFERLVGSLPNDKIVYYRAGQVEDTKGELVSEYIRKTKSAEQEALDYLTKLYILNKCTCLVGGICGGTIVAEYRKSPAYEYYSVR